MPLASQADIAASMCRRLAQGLKSAGAVFTEVRGGGTAKCAERQVAGRLLLSTSLDLAVRADTSGISARKACGQKRYMFQADYWE